jgi:hypothetical protein
MTVTFTFAVDWDADGSFATAGDDITAFVRDVKVSRGVRQDRPDARVAAIGQLTLVLDNGDGRFSPANSGGTYFGKLLPNREVRLQATDGVDTWTLFRGYTRVFVPQSGEGRNATCRMQCEDALGRLYRANVAIPLQEDETGGTIIKKVLAGAFDGGIATGTFTFQHEVVPGDRVTVNGTNYDFVAALTGGNTEVLAGTEGNAAPQNLANAINGGEGSGTLYDADIARNTDVTAEAQKAYGQASSEAVFSLGDTAGSDYVAQEIIPAEDLTVSAVELFVRKVGSPAFDLDCGVYDDMDAGSLIDANATFTITAADVTTTLTLIKFDFAGSFTLPKDTSSWLRLDPDGSSGTDYYEWGYVNSQPLDVAVRVYSNPLGSASTALVNTEFWFEGTTTIRANINGAWGNAIAIEAGTFRALATSSTVNTGTVAAGSILDTEHQDGMYYQINEVTGTPGFDVELDFPVTAGITGLTFHVYGRYQGSLGHTVNVDAWNGSTWDNLGTIVSAGSDALHNYTLQSTHTVSNNVRVRFYHASAGNATHDLYMDYLYVVVDDLVTSDNVIASGSTLSGGSDAPAGLLSIDDGIQEFPYAGDQWREAETNAFRCIQDVTFAEYGFFYVARDGTITWQDKNWFFERSNVAATLTLQDGTHGVETKGRLSGDDVNNRITVTYAPRIEESTGVIARAGNTIQVPGKSGIDRSTPEVDAPEDAVVIRLPFIELDTGTITGAKDHIHPVPNTDYTVNEASDGSGVDYTTLGNLTMSTIITATGLEITFKNTATGDLYVFDLQVRGTALISRDQQEIIEKDDTSITAYGRMDYDYNVPFYSTRTFSQLLAEYFLGRFKDPVYRVASITLADGQPYTLGGINIFELEIGDTIDLSEGQTGVSSNKFLITGIDTAIPDPAGGQWATITLFLQDMEEVTYWLLGETNFSELGETTVLAL